MAGINPTPAGGIFLNISDLYLRPGQGDDLFPPKKIVFQINLCLLVSSFGPAGHFEPILVNLWIYSPADLQM